MSIQECCEDLKSVCFFELSTIEDELSSGECVIPSVKFQGVIGGAVVKKLLQWMS